MSYRKAMGAVIAVALVLGIGCKKTDGEAMQQAPPNQEESWEGSQPSAGLVEGRTLAEEEVGEDGMINIVAEQMSFRPSVIVAKPGQKFTIELVNRGAGPHSIEVELPSGDRMLEKELEPGVSASLGIASPTEAGEYTFSCPVADHKDKGMTGKLIVR